MRSPSEILGSFGRYHRFFECLRQAEFHHRLGWNLDGLAGLGIAAHASLAIYLHRLAQPRNHKLPAALGFLRGQSDEFFEHHGRSLLRDSHLLSQMRDSLRFCHHFFCSSSLCWIVWIAMSKSWLSPHCM